MRSRMRRSAYSGREGARIATSGFAILAMTGEESGLWAAIRRACAAIRRAYAANRAYFRGLIVRAIEDALVLLLLGAAIWSVCHVVGGIFAALGVA